MRMFRSIRVECWIGDSGARLAVETSNAAAVWFGINDWMRNPIMKFSSIALAGVFALSSTLALAQTGSNNGGPSGRGSTMGDPAASSATPGTSPTVGSSMKASPSGSGTSTSGGRDANGDQGRDKMPESSQAVRPLDQQNKPDKM